MSLRPSIVAPGDTVALVLDGRNAGRVERDSYAFLEQCQEPPGCEVVRVLSPEGIPGFTAGGGYGVPLRGVSAESLHFRVPMDVPEGCYRIRHRAGNLEEAFPLQVSETRSADRADAGSDPGC